MKIVGIIAVVLAVWMGIWIFGGIIGIVSLPFHAAGNAIDTAHDVIDETINADNAIYNYEWFKQQKQDIETAKEQYQNALMAEDAFKASAGDRSTWTFEDKIEAQKLSMITLGLKNQIVERVRNYNARASMANRDIFRDGLLPDTLEFSASLIK